MTSRLLLWKVIYKRGGYGEDKDRTGWLSLRSAQKARTRMNENAGRDDFMCVCEQEPAFF